jgi:hypothetical protein
MDGSIQEAIQVFCPICARGVIVRNESMFKCKRCGREVCRACFDRDERQCLECVGERKPHDLRSAKHQIKDEGSAPEMPRPSPAAERPRTAVWLVASGLFLFAAGLSTSLLPAIPFWAGLLTAVAGVVLFAKGLISLLRS